MKCNICGKEKFKKVLSHYDNMSYVDDIFYNLVECINCSLVTIENKQKVEDIGKYYANNYYAYTASKNIFFILKNIMIDFSSKLPFVGEKIMLGQMYLKADKKNMSVLDIGCGDGYSLEMYKKFGFENLYGTEIEENLCKMLESKNIKVFKTLDITEIKFDKKFDVVRMSHVLEHVYNPSEQLDYIYKNLLKDDGKLIIGVPNFCSCAQKCFGKYCCALQLPTHLYHFNKKTLREILIKNNFKINSIFTTGFSGIAYSFITILKDKYRINLHKYISLLLVLVFLPIEILLNMFGFGFILTVIATKK